MLGTLVGQVNCAQFRGPRFCLQRNGKLTAFRGISNEPNWIDYDLKGLASSRRAIAAVENKVV
jgi:hypothetical protein